QLCFVTVASHRKYPSSFSFFSSTDPATTPSHPLSLHDALPISTHARRQGLFESAGAVIVDLCRRYYEEKDESVLPRNIATFEAFENAMVLDIAMGGSTNTVLHLLAAAQEAGVDFTMADIDRLSRQVPCLCKVSPAIDDVHVEDVHRAGGILGILAELARGGFLNLDVGNIHSGT